MDALQPHARGVGIVHYDLCKLLGKAGAVHQVHVRQKTGARYDWEYAVQHILQGRQMTSTRYVCEHLTSIIFALLAFALHACGEWSFKC